MAVVNVKILGISTSPRHANTEYAVKCALKSAEEMPGVKTDFISLAGKTIYPCLNCTGPRGHLCSGAPRDNPCPRIPNDDFREICLKMVEPNIDAYIMGAMVDCQSAGALFHCLKSRLICLEHNQIGPALRNKVFGAIAVGGSPYNGINIAQQFMACWALQYDMHVVGCGPDKGINCGGFLGAGGATYNIKGCAAIFRNRKPYKFGSREEQSAIKEDLACMRQSLALGKRVAEMAKVIKVGFEGVPKEELYWPKGAVQRGGYDLGQSEAADILLQDKPQ
ncbi:MAG: flavodoxin family protein [Chloroflexi bacterium]|nr:flavodoxin family protein [Chloroflexota bacterium]